MRLTPFKYTGGYSFGRNVAGHIAVAEKALGRRLPAGAVIHHVNGDGLDNAPGNLVICPDEAYHKLLHRRMRAQKACGNQNHEKCQYCGQWDAPTNMQSVRKSDRPSTTFWHGDCRKVYRKEFKRGKGYHV